MTVTLSADRIRISGAGRIEDAEGLVVLLRSERGHVIDLAEAEVLHTAVVQVLLAFRPRVTGVPDDPFFTTWLLPALIGDLGEAGTVTMAAILAKAAVIDANGPSPSTPSERT